MNSEFSPGFALNDGQWHSVEVSSRRGHVTIAVDDEEEGGVAHAGFFLTAGSQLFFGGKTRVEGILLETAKAWLTIYIFLLCPPGCPAGDGSGECSNPFDVFQGCMQLLSVNGQLVDLMAVQQRLLGNYTQLQIDMCGVIDRSESTKPTSTLVHPSW